MVDLSFLPAVNAALNGAATVMLVVGLVLILKRRVRAHQWAMISALAISALFLVSYVTHYVWRAAVAGGTHTAFEGPGWLGPVYYGVLVSHVLLAMAVPPLAIAMIWLGVKRRFATHRRLGRVAWPVWVYVSVTGVLIYFMLYHL